MALDSIQTHTEHQLSLLLKLFFDDEKLISLHVHWLYLTNIAKVITLILTGGMLCAQNAYISFHNNII